VVKNHINKCTGQKILEQNEPWQGKFVRKTTAKNNCQRLMGKTGKRDSYLIPPHREREDRR
jgi:hypothetical protein